MDPRRLLIMGGLAVVTYMMILQWNQDYGVKPTAVEQVAESTSATPDVTSEIPASSAPVEQITDAAPVSSASTATDAPQIESAAPEITTNLNTANLVNVKTDVVDVKLDLTGGDLVYLGLTQHPQALETPDLAFDLLERSQRRTFIVQSGLIGTNGIDKGKRAVYQSAQTDYELAAGQDQLNVDLVYQSAADSSVRIIKRYTFERNSYLIKIDYLIENKGEQAWVGNFYAQMKRDNSSDPGSQSGFFAVASYLGPAYSNDTENFEKYDFGDISDANKKFTSQGGWIAILQHYFVTALVPDADSKHNYAMRKFQGDNIVGYHDPAVQVLPGETKSIGTSLYAGPKIQDDLEEIAPYLNLSVDYGILFWIGKPLFWLLQFFHSIFGNWGWAIIGVTVVVKILFYWPSAASYRSMANLRRVAPKMEAIKARYGEDRQKMGQEMMALYRKEKVNPLGGCLPMLIQMPVFIALYWVLMESVELRQAPWAFWIEDLSVQDPYFVLPILMGVTMWATMQFQPTPADPTQAKVMKFMPLIFTFLFLGFPAGLVLYWVMNSILSLVQQYIVTKQIENKQVEKTAS